jgi:hypothetical protein
VIFEHFNNVFNLHRFHTGLGMREIWMLFVWTLLVVKLLKFLVPVICLFSLKTDAQFIKGGGNASEGSSSVSIRELWAEMDMMDEISHGGNSTGKVPRNVHRGRRSLPLVEKTDERACCMDKGALLNDTPRPSNAQPRGHGRGHGRCSAKNKVTRILSAVPRAISPCMRRSFVDRQYSPSTGMDLSEWEIILDELTRMGYIVKKEPDSDGNE